jgi:hypothetical protein
MIRRYIIWCNNHPYNERLRRCHRGQLVFDGDGDADGDGEGDGEFVRDGEGEAEGDLDGLGEEDRDGLGDGDGPANVGDESAGPVTAIWGRLPAGDGLAEADRVTVADALAGVAATAARLLDEGETLGRAAKARAEWEPATVSMMMLTVATIHTITTTRTVATAGFSRMCAHLSRLTVGSTCGSDADPAGRVSRCRYATAPGALEKQRFNTRSRSSAGSGSRRIRPDIAAGRSSPSRWLAQDLHCSTCRAIRSRARWVRWPSQSARTVLSSGQAPFPARATSSAPRAFSSLVRAAVLRTCARLRGTPSTSASSASCRSCRRLSSITSRSGGGSSARMPRISDNSSSG